MSLRLCFVVFICIAVAAAVTKKSSRRVRSLYRRPNIGKGQGSCADNEFKCNDGLCIQENWVCDTERDCFDGSDEGSNCPTDCTGANQFKCNNGKCIAPEYRCDFQNDCGDMTDEMVCPPPGFNDCPEDGHVHCDNFVCIESAWLCDSIDDCGDGWDERNCTGLTTPSQFCCADGSKCIAKSLECNRLDDCRDSSDELSCVCNETTEWKCNNGRCIRKAKRCNKDNDCGDASDELGCAEEHPSLCDDLLTITDCALMNETLHPICLDYVDGHRYCRKYCGLCITSSQAP
ncbi:hypothetical protein BsWGS_11785 [Bradybaena similaris]